MSGTVIKKPRLKKSLVQAKLTAADAALQIEAQFSDLNRKDRMLVTKAFQAQLIPPRPRGRKRRAGITAAHADWQGGMRGLELYQKHIPRFDQLSLWRRPCEIRRLLAALRNRERRTTKAVDDSPVGNKKPTSSMVDEPADVGE